MSRVAAIITDVSLDREFDYRVPEALLAAVQLGSRVIVPFGPRKIQGYVVGFPAAPRHAKLKDVVSVVGDRPYVDGTTLRLARWMSDYYCAPLEASVRTVLPGAVRRHGARFRMRKAVALTDTAPVDAAGLPEKQAAVLAYLQEHGSVYLDDIITELGVTRSPVSTLEKKGFVVVSEKPLHRNPQANREILRSGPLDLMPEQAVALKMIVDAVDAPHGVRSPGILPGHAASPSGGDAEAPVPGQNAQATGLTTDATPSEWAPRTGIGDDGRSPAPVAGAVDPPERSRVILLHGVTGSGKTEVYLQAIAHVLAQGQGAIVLVPEIALTPQTVERFTSRFGDQIAVLHSHLSDGERHDEWHRIRDGKAQVVVGARSAVFAPVVRLGLIVVDEEHEPSYKQEDVPRYNARDVAVMRGKMADCVVVLGSATPALESWYNTQTGKYALATLSIRADDRQMPAMRVIDMRAEMQRTGKPGVFSQDLVEAIRCRLDRAEQTILFLNRRGFATSLTCPSCGDVATCEFCSVSYTYHRTDDRLRCHICGADVDVPASCPGCADPAFKYVGIGTQRVEKILHTIFPKAAVQRMDADVTTRKDAYERILGDFRVGKTDILIGTQMIAKGLHFPNVTLVGVIYADLSLHVPDFRAGERTFQLLAQVAGRAGRGDVAGEVLVQTYTPFHWAVQAARRLDYEGLCDQELAFREELSYPPFSHLVCLTLRGKSQDKVAFAAQALGVKVAEAVGGAAMVAEACPAPLAKAKGFHRYQIMMRARNTSAMTRPLKPLLQRFKLPKGVRLSIDVDALSLL